MVRLNPTNKRNMAKKPETQKSGEILVRSCRYNKRSISCEWMQGADAYAVTFHDNPLPSFEKALAALPAVVCSLCGFPTKDAEKIEATGITIRPLGDDNEQGLVTAKKKIGKGKRVFNISTPLLAMYPGKDADKKGTDAMEEDEAKPIAKFASEVKKYILGERAQGKLAFEEEKPAPKKGAGENSEKLPGLTEPESD